ncbi:TIGR04086 family membrane protein [Bacillus solimangrovi]|uniref:TIGR04086 family membrane protein n=1 Tax=Bacillus solimangrovi TaxID=1305675 RepID=A0A1E5LBM1_9BACI|nr:TIGR04086 family membrane protein [Bacillus solimangrovi]OEH91488.1 hypothetical protein BFG57_05070 [Bacillus solimangrovi]
MNKHTWMSILHGVITIFIIVLLSSMILALLLRMTSLTEQSISFVILILSFLALFMGGFISGSKNQEKGWLTGMTTGVAFTMLVFLVQYLGYQTSFSVEQLLYHAGYILSAIIGGMLGVNIRSRKA